MSDAVNEADHYRGTGKTTRALERLIAAAANEGAHVGYVTMNVAYTLDLAVSICERSARRFEVLRTTNTLVVYGDKGGTIRFLRAGDDGARTDWRGRGRELVRDHAVVERDEAAA